MLDYYDYSRILSHNAAIMAIIGARGFGKTYGFKKLAIKSALKDLEQPQEFIYLRRYKTELRTFSNFFADIRHEFPGYDFRVNGNLAQARLTGDKKWVTIGYCLALSQGQTFKSMSFHNVRYVCFDEFIIEKGNVQYLRDEAKKIIDFYNTVDRYKDKTRMFLLGNSVSVQNPFLMQFKVEKHKGIRRYANGFMVTEFPESSDFADGVRKTRFGAFINEYFTEYTDYALGNNFYDGHNKLIERKPNHASYMFSLELSQIKVSFWTTGDKIYAQVKQPKNPLTYTMLPQNIGNGVTYLAYGDKLVSQLRTALSWGRLYSDKPTTRNALLELFKR